MQQQEKLVALVLLEDLGIGWLARDSANEVRFKLLGRILGFEAWANCVFVKDRKSLKVCSLRAKV